MTFREALVAATRRLAEAGVDDPARDARWLLSYVAQIPRDRITLMLDDRLHEAALGQFEEVTRQRERRVPVAQIIGEKPFYGRAFRVNPNVLSPRPETETLVSLALAEPFRRVLDLGTGSGAILVTLLLEEPQARGVGTDISSQAALVAGQNAELHGVADRVTLPLSEWWDDVGSSYDLIVSNPPYIAVDEMPELMPEVRDHEPREALTDEADGLSAYREIVLGAPDHLTPGGRLMVEIGHRQAQDVVQIFEAAGLAEIRVERDLDQRDRVVWGRKSS